MRKSIRSPDERQFRALLREARQGAGLTQRDLALRLGKPRFVAKYEAGERRLDVLEFLAVARAIGTDPIALMRKLIAHGA